MLSTGCIKIEKFQISQVFEFLQNSSDSSRKQIFRELFFYFIMKLYVVCTH